MTSEAAYLARLRDLHRRSWPKGMPTEVRYPHGERPLTHYLRAWAQERPDKAAVVYYGATMTYAELDALSDRFAALLAAHGIGRGDRVAVYLPNCPQFHVAFYGILKLGAVHVPVSPLAKSAELEYQLSDAGATAVLALDQLMPEVRAVAASVGLRTVFVTSLAEALPEEPSIPVPDALRAPRVPCPDAVDLLPALAAVTAIPDLEPGPGLDDVAVLNYTGGTTGLPKGCIHTQRDMLHTAAVNWSIPMQADPEIVTLSFLPEFWIAGENAALILPVFTGSTLVLMTRWDPVGVLAAVERHRVTSTVLPVDGAVELMEHPRFHDFDLRTLTRVRVVSFVKKLNLEYRRRWKDMAGSTLMESAWGMTETHTSDTFTVGMQDDDFDLKSQPVFVGLPLPGTELTIRDFATGELMPLGAEGEICVRTPSLFKGYWNRPDATAQAVRDGWLHTGDIGVIDEGGYLHYLGRRKEMLKVKGMSVFPAEIEALLGQHPDLLGSGVVGREDAERGQVPVAFVQPKPEAAARLTADALAAWCRERMAGYKVPEIRIVERLPMTATGKVRKADLAKEIDA